MTMRAELSALIQWAFLWSSPHLLGVGPRCVLREVVPGMEPWKVDRVLVTFKVHPENEVRFGFRHTTFMDGEGSMKILLDRVNYLGFAALKEGNGTLEACEEGVIGTEMLETAEWVVGTGDKGPDGDGSWKEDARVNLLDMSELDLDIRRQGEELAQAFATGA
ncbi:hypothetical protein LTR17_027525 [Elasticomyces elasticus]|nr:hypothetical protein LTR17_027525 [Elasticomyces elasticus]